MGKILQAIANFLSFLGFRVEEWFTGVQARPENVRATLAQAQAQDMTTADQAERAAAQMGSAVDEMSRNLVNLQNQARAAALKADQNMQRAATVKGKTTQEQFYFAEATRYQIQATRFQSMVNQYAAQLATQTQNLDQAKRFALGFYGQALRHRAEDEFLVADAVFNALNAQFNNQLRGILGIRPSQQGSDVRRKLQGHIQRQKDYNTHDADLLKQMAQMAGMAQYAGAEEGATEADQQALAALKAKYGYTPSFEEAASADKSETASSAGSGN